MLLAWDTPTQSLSAGWTRYTLERRFGQRVTAVRVASLARADLADFDVHRPAVGQLRRRDQRRGARAAEGLAARRRHADHAGRSHAVGDRRERRAARHQAAAEERQPRCARATSRRRECRSQVRQRCHARLRHRARAADGAAAANGGRRCPSKPGRARSTTTRPSSPTASGPTHSPGAILRVMVDTDHWLSAGQDAESQTMIEGNRVFAPLRLNSGRNVGIYADQGPADRLGLDLAREPGSAGRRRRS